MTPSAPTSTYRLQISRDFTLVEATNLLDYLVDTSVFDRADGYVARLDRPGLGIEVDAKAVERAAEIGHRWRSPVWRHPDGSFAEW